MRGSALLYDLIRPQQQRRRDGEPEPVPSIYSSGRSSCRAPHVFVMQPTNARDRDYPAFARLLHRSVLRCVFAQK